MKKLQAENSATSATVQVDARIPMGMMFTLDGNDSDCVRPGYARQCGGLCEEPGDRCESVVGIGAAGVWHGGAGAWPPRADADGKDREQGTENKKGKTGHRDQG